MMERIIQYLKWLEMKIARPDNLLSICLTIVALFDLFTLFDSFGFLDFNAQGLGESSKVPGQGNWKLPKNLRKQF